MSKKHISLCIAVLAVLLGATPLLHARSAMQEQLYDVNLSMSGATVRSLTSELTRQMGILFSYETDLASRVVGDVAIRESKADMDAILNAAFAGSGISWKAVNRTVVLTADPQPQAARGRKTVISGRVTDASGSPLPGAGVFIKGQTVGVTTDMDGPPRFPRSTGTSSWTPRFPRSARLSRER